ncbi:copper homeostasis protein CutC [Frateuria aurantia]
MSDLLEIACNSLASVEAAVAGGAGRIELCAALELGGLTPSYAQIALARERTKIPLYVLIRPRAGDFLYSAAEVETMLFDIEMCARLGCDGIVVGALDAGGGVDVEVAGQCIEAAGHLGATFHRAIDVCSDPRVALEAVIALGYERVLTSGQAARAVDGAPLISELVRQARGRIRIMAGGGVRAGHLAELKARTGCHEFHASASHPLPSGMTYRAEPGLDMVEGELRSQAATVRALAEQLGGDH